MKAKLHAVVAAAVLTFAFGCTNDDPTTDETPPVESDELRQKKGGVDHAAIVEATTMMLVGDGPLPPADPILDPYNQADPFALGSAKVGDVFKRNLAKYDRADGHTDWSPEQVKLWVGRLATGNYLVIDTAGRCGERGRWEQPNTYLEIEKAQLTGRSHHTCGGRMPNEDALDVTINFLVRGPTASTGDEAAISDGVDEATKPASDMFPYLAEMN